METLRSLLWWSTLAPLVILFLIASADTAVQAILRSVMRTRVLRLEAIVLFSFVGFGLLLLYFVLHSRIVGVAENPVLVLLGSFGIYVAILLLYFQCKSFFSRGYSISILVDVARYSSPPTVKQLKDNYGRGMGVRGLLVKRIASMAALKLLAFDGVTIGPLYTRGRVAGAVTTALRRILKLENVG